MREALAETLALNPERLFSGFTPEQVLHAFQDVLNGRIEVFTPEAMLRRRGDWIRQELMTRSEVTPRVRMWLWGVDRFFLKWVLEAGALDEGLSADWLKNSVLKPETRAEDDIAMRALEIALLEDESTRRSAAARLLPSVMSLRGELIASGLLTERESRYHLMPELQMLGEAELPLAIRPEHLRVIDAARNYELLVRCVRLAPADELDLWCHETLNLEGVAHHKAVLAVLDGLAQRDDKAHALTKELLTQIWLSALDQVLRAARGDTYMPFCPQLRRASEVFADRLPILDAHSSALRSLQMCATSSEADEARDDNEVDVMCSLAGLVPYQIPFETWCEYRSQLPPHEQNLGSDIALHHARRGELFAMSRLLTRQEIDAMRLIDSLAIVELLQWWQSLEYSCGEPSTDDWLDHDLQRAIRSYLESLSEDLRLLIKPVLERGNLWPCALSDGLHALHQVRSVRDDDLGKVVEILTAPSSWLTSPDEPRLSCTEQLLVLTEILEAKDVLRWIVAIEPV